MPDTIIAPQDSTPTRLQAALGRHRAGDLDGAADIYGEVLTRDPDNADALHLLGLVAHAQGDGLRALDLIGRAVERSPSPRNLANYGMVLSALGRHDDAIASCVRALAGRVDYPEAWNTLGVALAALERLEPALAAHDKALALRADYADAHLNRAGLLAAMGRLGDAETAFRAAFALCPALNPSPATPRIVFVATDREQPGSLYRCARMAAAAREAGWDAVWITLAEVDDDRLRAANAVLFWRVELRPAVGRMVALARAGGARVGLDIDDLIVDPELARLDVVDGIRTIGSTEAIVRTHFTRMNQMLHAADFATCTTPELARVMRRAQKPVWVLPNGFDSETLHASRAAMRQRRREPADGLLRIGYAGGTRTHQRDMREADAALARVLRARPDARLVLFRDATSGEGLVLLDELPALHHCRAQIEWRDLVPLAQLPAELARFDINIAPLEPDNAFVECKSELKYFEAALVSVPTIASPSEPFRRAIRHGVNGMLAEDESGWEAALQALLDSPEQRAAMARAAYHDALWHFGPQRRARQVGAMLDQLRGGAQAALGFAGTLAAAERQVRVPEVPASDTLWQSDRGGDSAITVTVAAYNYAGYMVEALDSVAAQSLAEIDLVVVDDGSSDDSVAVARTWLQAHAERFQRSGLLATRTNAGLGGNRNVGFDWAETPFVLPLDADNRLLPDCAARLLRAATASRAAFAYPSLRQFGACETVLPAAPFEPERLRSGNYIDAMALVAKWAWAAVGGYYVDRPAMGWEDYDLWCSLAELGLHGEPVAEVLAEYRVHAAAMTETLVETASRKPGLVALLERRHPWLEVLSRAPTVRRRSVAAEN